MRNPRISILRALMAGTSVFALAAAMSVLALPTPAVAATPDYVGAAVDGRGTVLGSASYTPPSGAIYVSPSGSDAEAGTAAKPVKTVARALDLVPTGGTVVLRAGSYHESVTIRKQVTVQNYPREIAWFDGSSAVSGWTKSGSVWTSSWSTFFAPSKHSGGVRADYPYAQYPAQVFLGQTALKEVGSRSEVVAGTFFADSAKKQLVIGSDPSGQAVRASDLKQAIAISVPNVNLRGFGVRRYATDSTARAAVLMDPDGGTFENLVVADNASIGLALSGANKTIRNITSERNGMIGLGMDRADRAVIKDSVIRDNNTERFPTQPVASGIKITRAKDLKITGNLISGNYLAAGLWLDEFCRDAVIAGNVFRDNGELQVNLEASSGGMVVDNVVEGGRKGVELRDVENVRVMNNHFSDYSMMAINLAQDERWKTLTSRPSDISLRVRNNTIANNVIACGSRFQIFGKDASTNIPMDDFKSTITGNVFSPSSKSPELNMVAWGLSDNSTVEFLQTTDALAKKNSSWTNLQSTKCVDRPDESFADSVLQKNALPLPADVAAATGVATGTKLVGTVSGSKGGSGSTKEPPATPKPTPEPSQPATDGKLPALDNFDRKLTKSWGRSDSGHTWKLTTSASAFYVTGSRAAVALKKAATHRATLTTEQSSAVELKTIVALNRRPSTGTLTVSLVGRQVGSSTYAGALSVTSSGKATVKVTRDGKQIGKSYQLSGKYKAGQKLHLRVSVSGTKPTEIKIRVWASGKKEPSKWQVVTTDSTAKLQAPGSVGVTAQSSKKVKTTVRVYLSDYRVTALG